MNTVRIGPLVPDKLGNPKLRFHLFGFVGVVWIDIPFATAGEASTYADEHGWKVGVA